MLQKNTDDKNKSCIKKNGFSHQLNT